MVQVDIFWSYGLSAGLALASQKTIKASTCWWNNHGFIFTLLWISCIFAPSGLYLLWQFPAWETMFTAEVHKDIPAWLVTLFGLTNVTQGLLGFYITASLIRAGRKQAAILQTIWSHGAMLFILVFGWDGTGYRRFFYAGTGPEWHQGVSYDISQFFAAPIFYSLVGLGVIFIPTYFGLVGWLRRQI